MLHARLRIVLRPFYAGLRLFFDALVERRLGIETSKVVPLHELGLAASNRVDYEPSSWFALRRVLSKRDVTEDDVFIDFGCGKGRIVFQAARYRFKKVIGIELSPQLTAIANDNIERSLVKLRCKNIELVNKDVLQYEIPDDVTVAYFYNPFEGDIFAAVVDKLVASLKRRPRLLKIIYFSPREEDVLLRAGARLLKVARGRRPTKAWSRANSIRMYALGPFERSVEPGNEGATQS